MKDSSNAVKCFSFVLPRFFFFFFPVMSREHSGETISYSRGKEKKVTVRRFSRRSKLTGMKNCQVALARCTKGRREELMITLPFAELCVTSPILADSDPKGTSASLRSVSEIRV